MALYDPVDGVYRKVAKKYDPVDGVYRNVTKAYDPVDGVYRQYFSGGNTAGALAVGDSVWLNVNGTLTEFLVVHQGNPDSTLYDASCDGTWLLMKDCYGANMPWDEDEYDQGDELISEMSNDYGDSSIHYWLHNYGGFYYELSNTVKDAIKQVKLPYTDADGNAKTGSNGLSSKVFLLSIYEVGHDGCYSTQTEPCTPTDGACLDYFSSAVGQTGLVAIRQAKYNGTNRNWWLRSSAWTGISSHENMVWRVDTYGGCGVTNCGNQRYVRPAFILDSNTPFAQADGKNIIE